MSADNSTLQRFVEQAGSLYSLPTVAIDILQLTSQPKVDLAALKTCLLRDPALVGKLLRVVNSSLFGLSRGVSDLNQALALLGTKSVRLLVLGFSLPDELFIGLAGDVLRRYWHHTALKAAAAREISETIYRLPGEEAFIAGLLQDLGMLVLIQQLGEPYVRFLERAHARSLDMHAAERVTLGFDHVQLTARLLGRWGLPENLITAIDVGNSPDRMAQLAPAQRALPQILHLADLLAGMLAEGRADWLGELLEIGRSYRQLSGVQLTAIVESLHDKVKQLAEVLSLELPEGVDYSSIFAEAHRQLSVAADDAALELALTRRTGVIASGDAESELLVETELLSEAVRRFAQQPQKPAARPAKAAPVASLSSNPQKLGVGNGPRLQVGVELAVVPSQVLSPEIKWIHHDDSLQQDAEPLAKAIEAAVARCRQLRQPLSLILVEIDRFDDLISRPGAPGAQQFVQFVGLVCGRLEHAEQVQLQVGPSQFGLVLPNCDRSEAVELAHQLLMGVRGLSRRQPDVADARLTVSIGSATATMISKNFLPQALLDSAQRCLNAAQLSSGNALKSIDVM